MTQPIDETSLSNNQRTVQAYEGYARQYAAAVSQESSGIAREGIERMAAMIPNGTILEVGSGPGWDADYAETLGFTVRRTDVTKTFRDFQIERGKAIDALDILTDDFGGPYDGIVALYVLQHVERDQVAPVLDKVAQALKKDGVFFVALREGRDELWERSERSGDYHITLWDEADFVNALTTAGLQAVWFERNTDEDGNWLVFIAGKHPQIIA